MAESNSFQRTRVSSTPASTRRAPRRIFKRAIGILLHGKYILAHAQQLSEGGMLLESSVKLAVKETVVVSIVIPGGHALVTRAEIIYLKQVPAGATPQYGMKFAALSLPLRRIIRNYVTAKTQAEAEAETHDWDPI